MAFLKKNWSWLPALFVAFVFLSSMPFKLGGAPITQHIFSTVATFLGAADMADVVRYGTASLEIVASVLFLIPALRVFGALLAFGLMSGAIFFHLASPLGIVVQWTEAGAVQTDETLFMMAVLAWIASLSVLIVRRDSLPIVGGRHQQGAVTAA